MALAYWLGTRFSLFLFGHHISGELWAVIGAVLGALFADARKH